MTFIERVLFGWSATLSWRNLRMYFLLQLWNSSSFVPDYFPNESPYFTTPFRCNEHGIVDLNLQKRQSSFTNPDLFDHICDNRFMLLFKRLLIIDMLHIHGIPHTTLSISNERHWVTLKAFHAASSLMSNTSFQCRTPFNFLGGSANELSSPSRSWEDILFSRSFRLERGQGVWEYSQEFPKSEMWRGPYRFVNSLGWCCLQV